MSFSESELAQDGFDASLYRGYSEIGNNASTGTVDSFSNLAVSINESNNKSTTTINDNTTSLTSSITTDVNANTDTATGGITTDVNTNTDIQPKLQSSMGFSALFGDGRDGDVTISGTTYVNENKQYANLTIQTGGIITSSTNKYIHIAVSGILTIEGTGKITADGFIVGYNIENGAVDGAGSGAGVEYLDVTTRWGASGGGGGGAGNSGAGNPGGNGYSLGGLGGVGGSNPGDGVDGVSINQITKDNADLKLDILLYAWGASGGGANTVGAYSIPGYGGGVIYIEAKTIVIESTSGSITSKGTDGVDGIGASEGGGGGGGGGIIIIKYSTLTNAQSNNSNLTVNGGSGGIGVIAQPPSGGDGGNGGDGYLFLQQISK